MKRSIKRNRRGAAMVEFAIVAPILFLLFFASFEFCRVAMIRHTADNAVYEACRVGIIPGATTSEVQNQAQQVLATIGVTNASITVTPTSFDRDTEEVRVQVVVDLDSNTFVPNQFVNGRSITRDLTLRREGNR